MIEPGYYRLIKKDPEFTGYDDINIGDIVICSVDEDGDISATFPDNHFTYDDIDKFNEYLVFEPKGKEIISKRIVDAMEEINEANQLFSDVSNQLLGFDPHVEVSGEVSGSTSLVPRDSFSIGNVKKALAQHVIRLPK